MLLFDRKLGDWEPEIFRRKRKSVLWSENDGLELLFEKWQKCPRLRFMGRMDGSWASLGRGNPGGPESIDNKLGLGSDGPRIQLYTINV